MKNLYENIIIYVRNSLMLKYVCNASVRCGYVHSLLVFVCIYIICCASINYINID